MLQQSSYGIRFVLAASIIAVAADPLPADAPTSAPAGKSAVLIEEWAPDESWEVSRLDTGGDAARGIICGESGKNLYVWTADTLTSIHVLSGHAQVLHPFRCSPDGRWAVSSSADPKVNLWDLSKGELMRQVPTDGRTDNLAIAPSGKEFATIDLRNRLQIWAIPECRELRIAQLDKFAVLRHLEYSRDGKFLMFFRCYPVRGIYEAVIWDVTRARERKSLDIRGKDPKAGEYAHGACFTPDGASILLWGSKSHVRYEGEQVIIDAPSDCLLFLIDIETGREIRRYEGHTYEICNARFSPDGRTFLSGSVGDRTIRLWDVGTGRELWRGHTEYGVWDVAFTPDGKRAVAASRKLMMWDISRLVGDPSAASTKPVTKAGG